MSPGSENQFTSAITARVADGSSHRCTTIHVAVTRVLLEHGALDQWKDRYGRRANEYITDDAISMLFFRYNLPCNTEHGHVSSRSTPPINIEENIERPHHNEAPQDSDAQQPGPFRARTFANVPITTEDTDEALPAKRGNLPHPNV